MLRWLAAHIGIHHVHHLSSRIIPCYRPGEALRDHSELQGVSRLTLTESVRCRRLALWDEDQRIAASWLMQISAAERWLR